MAKVVHISDIHFPLLFTRDDGWNRRWEMVIALVRRQKPDFIVVTGDVIESAWPPFFARRRLREVLQVQLPQAFDPIPFIVVPGSHDIKNIQGMGKGGHDFAALFQELTRDKGGWQQPIAERIHLFTIDSNHSEWFAHGRIVQRDLESAIVPPDCADRHVHIFALHHSIRIDPAPRSERALTTEKRTLGLDDPKHLLATLAKCGFDVVLHGHRHLSTLEWYANPLAHRRPEACLLIGAPSATKQSAQGFNWIEDDAAGAFEVYAVRHASGEVADPQLIASRDYGEIRTRRWKHQVKPKGRPSCDRVDVSIMSYQEGTDNEKDVQRIGGDVKIEVTLHRLEYLGDTMRFPLTSVVGYRGIEPRALSAHWTDIDGQERPLNVNDDGTIDVRNVRNPRSLRTEVVLLNGVPYLAGDWSRMKAWQEDLQDVVDVRLALPARFLRIRVDLAGLASLQPVARLTASAEHLATELEFMALYAEAQSGRCKQEIMVFHPLAGVGYCLTSSADPVAVDTGSVPVWAAVLQTKLAKFRELSPEIRVRVQHALDRLREEIIELARLLPKAKGDGADISADLLSITGGSHQGGQRVELTDQISAARFQAKRLPSFEGVTFAWGAGVAGRALRLQQWLTWQRDSYGKQHPTAWPARDWYVPVAKYGFHTYICCGPIMTEENSETHMVGMLSFASQDEPSLLKYVIQAMREPYRYPRFNEDFNAAVFKFSVRLGVELLEDNEVPYAN